MTASGTIMSTDFFICICVQYLRIMLKVSEAKIFECSIVHIMSIIISADNGRGTTT